MKFISNESTWILKKKMFHIFCLVWHQVEEMCTPDTEHKTVFTKVNRCNWDGQRKEWVSCCRLQKKRKNIFCYITYTQNIAFSFFASTTLNTNTLLTIAAMMFWPNYIPHWNIINKGLGENDTLQKSCKYLTNQLSPTLVSCDLKEGKNQPMSSFFAKCVSFFRDPD